MSVCVEYCDRGYVWTEEVYVTSLAREAKTSMQAGRVARAKPLLDAIVTHVKMRCVMTHEQRIALSICVRKGLFSKTMLCLCYPFGHLRTRELTGIVLYLHAK